MERSERLSDRVRMQQVSKNQICPVKIINKAEEGFRTATMLFIEGSMNTEGLPSWNRNSYSNSTLPPSKASTKSNRTLLLFQRFCSMRRKHCWTETKSFCWMIYTYSCLSLWLKCLLINRLIQTFCLQDSKQLLPPPYKLAYECMLETRIWALNSSFPRLILLTWLPCLLQLMPRL